ncbi:phosphate acetyltransferase [Thiovibrio frasassiensis]|uniref:Phosphate acetyltransferase n=1 Tax=Thiovibrio frasassiensis TaxID=2984131 RepID=A0A9X4MLV4_9BACT|nr:phosphate acetyltransferase [Thiovibrio frasassiensis]MDG4475217.1 phosphate acetyltransferase [Thiovibrio frasassiensis]
MAQSVYIVAIGPQSGKSVVALGIMELLSRRLRRVGYFRPIIPSHAAADNNLQLIKLRYRLAFDYDEMFALSHDEAQHLTAEGRTDQILKTILNKYRQLESKCDFILCEGTDFSGLSLPFEFEFNAEVVNNLGCTIMLLLNCHNKSPADILDALHVAQDSFLKKGCTILASVVNRVDPLLMGTVREKLTEYGQGAGPVYILPEEPFLGKPTVGEIAKALDAQILMCDPEEMNREVSDFKVAAMNLPHFLDHLVEGDLIIAPGDRSDIILGSLAANFSSTYPSIAGLLLSGGFVPDPQISLLLQGLSYRGTVPIISVQTDTYTTAMNASAVPPMLTPENDRKIAAALGLFETHIDLAELEGRISLIKSTRVTPLMFEYNLVEMAQKQRQHIVLPEGAEERILRASEMLTRRGVAQITLLGDPAEIRSTASNLGLSLSGIEIIDPLTSALRTDFAQTYFALRQHKGITEKTAFDTVGDVNYFGTMMIHKGLADGMVSGAVHTTGDTIRPALQIIRTQPDVSLVSSVFLMCLADRVLVYGDCAVNPEPNAQQLAEIAISSAQTAKLYGIDPLVAMCSYATGASGKGADVDKVREATRIAKELRPELKIEGPIQYDAAVDAGVAKTKLPESQVAGKATVFIFPDLNTGNNLYKAVQRSANAVAIGPVLQGLNKPVNDLSRGCTVPDIVNTVAITAIQAQAARTSQGKTP